jgi:hypothetical protein
MRLRAKVVIGTWQWPATAWVSTPMTGARPSVVLFKFTMSEDRQVALQGRKGLVGTKLGLDKDLTPTQVGAQIRVMGTIQGGQGGRQTCLLVHNRALCRQHSDLPILYLGSLGFKGSRRSTNYAA